MEKEMRDNLIGVMALGAKILKDNIFLSNNLQLKVENFNIEACDSCPFATYLSGLPMPILFEVARVYFYMEVTEQINPAMDAIHIHILQELKNRTEKEKLAEEKLQIKNQTIH